MRFFLLAFCFAAAGLSAQQITPKIVGGKDTLPGDYPWMVGLMDKAEADNFYAQFCGGVLIHPYYVLTAAHCVEGESILSMDLLVGTDDLDFGGRRVSISKIIQHPLYNEVSLENDIALVRLSTPVLDIEPVNIADQASWQAEGIVARILGWGRLSEGGGFPDELQEADVTIGNYSQANAAWSYSLVSSMMPATGFRGSTDSCGGDSGGPLLVRRDFDDAWVIAGIVSFGSGCGVYDPPAIYTRVFSFRDFIYGIIYPDFAEYAQEHDQFALNFDADEDSLNLLLEYGLNSDPDNGDLTGAPMAGQTLFNDEPYAAMTFNRRRGMDDFVFILEQAADLDGPWESMSLLNRTVSKTILDSKTERLTVRANDPIDEAPFLRLRFVPTGNL